MHPLLAAAKVVITSDEVVRGGKVTPIKVTVDSAVKDCASVEKVFVVTRTDADVPMYRRDVFLKEVLTTRGDVLMEPLPPKGHGAGVHSVPTGATGQ